MITLEHILIFAVVLPMHNFTLEESKRSLTKCILFRGSWYAPLDFESLCGRKSKKWRQSITHLGKPLSEYYPKQGSQHGAGIVGSRVDSQPPCSSVSGLLTDVLDTSTPALSVPVLQPNSCSQGSSVSSPLLISAVLSFIKSGSAERMLRPSG